MVNRIIEVFLVSLSAMFKVALISSVGILCSMYPKAQPLLNPMITKGLSRLSNFVLIPALVASSLGSTVSIPLLKRFGILSLLCVIIMLISYTNTWAFKWLHEDNPKLFKATLVSVSSPNAISFPLLVMRTMCEDSTVNADYGSDSNLCFQEASSMMFIYSIGWHCVYWSYGFPLLKSLDSAVVQPVGFIENVREFTKNVLFSPSLLAIYAGILIAVIPNLQDLLFITPSILRPLGSSLLTLAEPVVCTNTLIMSASLAQVYFSIVKSREENKVGEGGEENFTAVTSPLHDAAVLSSESLGTEDKVEITFEEVTPAADDIEHPTIGGRLQEDAREKKHTVPQWRSVAVMIICRLYCLIFLIFTFLSNDNYYKTFNIISITYQTNCSVFNHAYCCQSFCGAKFNKFQRKTHATSFSCRVFITISSIDYCQP